MNRELAQVYEIISTFTIIPTDDPRIKELKPRTESEVDFLRDLAKKLLAEHVDRLESDFDLHKKRTQNKDWHRYAAGILPDPDHIAPESCFLLAVWLHWRAINDMMSTSPWLYVCRASDKKRARCYIGNLWDEHVRADAKHCYRTGPFDWRLAKIVERRGTYAERGTAVRTGLRTSPSKKARASLKRFTRGAITK